MPGLLTWWTLDLAELAPHAHSDAVTATGTDLLRRLGEGHRRYHTARHVVEMFWALEELEGAGHIGRRDAALARVAACFHDAVYDPGAAGGQNEAASAALAANSLRALGVDAEDVATVRELVLATATHPGETERNLAASFLDADLWVLAAPPERFDEYCAQVREEYAAVPDGAYAQGRTAILEPFLRRDAVYVTAYGRSEWEAQARSNLARELSRLRD